MLTATGVVMTVETNDDARTVRNAAARRDEFAVHTVRVVDARAARSQHERLAKQRERMRQRCRRYSVGSVELERLDAALAELPPAAAVAMLQLIDLCIADTGFLLVIVDDAAHAGLPLSFLEAAQTTFDRELLADASPDLGLSVQLTRPAPERLERSLDRDLLAAIVGDGDAAIQAWRAWRTRSNLDESVGVGKIAPMLSENLSRVGVDDVDLGRINGIRRRAWYLNQLIAREAATAVDCLLEKGFDPILLGDLPAAVRAAETGSVRPVRAIDLCVRPETVTRVADALTRLGWTPGGRGPITEPGLEWRTWQRFRIDPGRVLFLHWRPLPQRCSHLVAPSTDDSSGRVVLHDVEVTTQSPTAELLRLWARTGDAIPGHQLRTLCDTADLLARHPDEIDWVRLSSDCERLGLVEYGETYLRTLPAGLGEPGIRELQSREGC